MKRSLNHVNRSSNPSDDVEEDASEVMENINEGPWMPEERAEVDKYTELILNEITPERDQR